MSVIDDILKVLDQARDEIRDNLEAKKINASGRTSEGFQTRATDSGAQLVYIKDRDNDGAPLSTIENGRPSGNVPKNFTEIIEQWSRDKGLSFPNDKARRTFAGAVAWGKIRRRGYGRPSPSNFGSSDPTVYTPVAFETAKRLYNEIPKVVISYIQNLKR